MRYDTFAQALRHVRVDADDTLRFESSRFEGAAEATLRRVESELGRTLPTMLRELLADSNGLIAGFFSKTSPAPIDILRIYGADEIVETTQWLLDETGWSGSEVPCLAIGKATDAERILTMEFSEKGD